MAIDTVHIYFRGLVPNQMFDEIGKAFTSIGFQVLFRKDSKQAWRKSDAENALSIFERRAPNHKNALQAVPVFGNDFWVLESAGFPKDMGVAKAIFESQDLSEGKVEREFEALQAKYIHPFEHDYAFDDFVLIILDGDLGKDEPNRPMSSFNMIKQVLKNEPERQVLIWQEPESDLSDNAQARSAEFDLEDRITFTSAPIDRLLNACSFVVAQDSLIGLQALLHKKPVLMMGDFPFHHILRNPERDGRLQKSFNRMHRDQPEFEYYLAWLLNEQCLHVKSKSIEADILSRCQELGW